MCPYTLWVQRATPSNREGWRTRFAQTNGALLRICAKHSLRTPSKDVVPQLETGQSYWLRSQGLTGP